MENQKLLPISIVILAISVIVGSIWIGYSLEKTANLQNSILTSVDNKVLNLSQVAEYLNMKEEEISGIIQIEKVKLEKTGSFSGKMFPYFTINNKRYFYKNEIDEWLKEVSNSHSEYDTLDGWVLQ
ncbi:hypothetical protein [Clostridium sp. ZS2-4]|uniref:hypothetical protein n=1 Tax=Clostridium sp. ZS2-4 TaxID=2987703 RepID=UPI00227B3DE3|nr:hypothetical protein [Clostridium sp. ZS2-4]MCY6356333.1 hypothetical protein [Clostridium sp. ZS2-4]